MTNCPWVTARVRRRQLVDRAGQWRRATDIRQFVARVAEHAATLSDAAEGGRRWPTGRHGRWRRRIAWVPLTPGSLIDILAFEEAGDGPIDEGGLLKEPWMMQIFRKSIFITVDWDRILDIVWEMDTGWRRIGLMSHK